MVFVKQDQIQRNALKGTKHIYNENNIQVGFTVIINDKIYRFFWFMH